MVCQKCGTPNADGCQFCVNCGAPLAAPQYQQPQYQQPQYQQPQYPQAPYQQPQYPQAPYQQPPADPGKGMAIAALVLGIISFFCFPAVTGLLGIIFGSVARSKGTRSGGMAMGGIICGIIGIVLWIIMLAAGISLPV